MTMCWITRNAEGVVRAASVVEYTEPRLLTEWITDGRTPELVDFGNGPVTLNKQLPASAKVVRTLRADVSGGKSNDG